MNLSEIKQTVSNLEKITNDDTILDLLKVLEADVIPTESLLRETKVGVVVNKFRTHRNNEIKTLVKKIIKNWKELVQIEKNNNKKINHESVSNSKPKGQVTDTNENENKKDTNTKIEDKKTQIYTKPRNFKNDNIENNIYHDSTRNASISALYTALAFERDDNSQHILKIAKEIENEVFKSENLIVDNNYRNRIRNYTMNIKNKKNPGLRNDLLTQKLKALAFINMSPNEIASDSLKKEMDEIKKKNLFDAQGATEKRAVTDRFTCGKCKEKKVSYYQLQTRSADEPLTTFCTCEACGNRWKFS